MTEKRRIPNMAVKNYTGVAVERLKNTPFAENAEMRLKDAIIDKVLEANDIEIPQELVDEEAAMMIVEYKHRMKYESMASGSCYDFMADDLAELREALTQEAFKLVKTRLVLKAIIEAEGIDVTKEELEKEAKAVAARQQMPIEKVLDFLGEDLELLKDDLLIRKAIDFIYANAVIT